MAIYPRIQNPCPYKGQLSEILDGEVCRLCERQVFDLTHMSDGERVAFMQGCTDQVCVTYRFPVRPALAAATIAVAAIGIPSAAAACSDPTSTEEVVFVGGIKDTANVRYVKDTGESAAPALPVVYEDKPVHQQQAPTPPAEDGAKTGSLKS
jgi:hypothetical protein